jgi:hypothetical protein
MSNAKQRYPCRHVSPQTSPIPVRNRSVVLLGLANQTIYGPAAIFHVLQPDV